MKKKKMSALDKYLIFCIAFFTVYTIVEVVTSSITGTEHATLTEAVKWFCCGEAFLCCMIKRLKLKRGNSDVGEVDESEISN